jgi:DNA (cytosine-5)-methyltransferase 1
MTPDIIIDLFAGGGGTSTGIEAATGRSPDIAVNHDAEALALHAANHPDTLHLCDDIRQIDVVALLSRPEFLGRRVGLLWASPDCKDHSKAKGGVPKDKNIRGLAWEVLRWTAAIRRATGKPPRTIALENVEEFADWGPIHRYGKNAGRVMKRRRKETFRLWKANLESLGGRLEERELVAANYGAPTTRKRLYVVCRFDGDPIVWPEPTHAPRHAKGRQGELFDAGQGLIPYRAASDIIDWTQPIPSIFGRRKSLAPKTERRIARGIDRFVIRAQRPFIIPVTHSTGGDRAYDAGDPLRTATAAKGGDFQLVAPTFLPVTHAGDDRAHGPEDQLRTVTGAHRGELAVGAAFLNRTDMQSAAERNGIHSPGEPLRTFTSAGGFAATTAYLGRQFGSTVSGRDLTEPHPAVMTDGAGGKSQVVAAHIARQFGGSVGSDLAEPVGTVMPGGSGKTQLVAPVIDKYYATGVAQEAARPLDAVTAKARFGLTGAFVEQANTGVIGHAADKPVSTILAAGSHQRLVGADLEPWDAALAAIGAPPGSKRREVLAFLWSHFGAPTEAEWADPAATIQGRLRFGLVILDGATWQIVDIGMRMLTPRELYSAQGFPPGYVIELTLADGRTLTKTAQTRMAGNSVSPPVAAAIIGANCAWLREQRQVAA